MSSRGPDAITPAVHAPPLPPEIEIKTSFIENLKFLKGNHMKALIWKNFLWMWRNVGYVWSSMKVGKLTNLTYSILGLWHLL